MACKARIDNQAVDVNSLTEQFLDDVPDKRCTAERATPSHVPGSRQLFSTLVELRNVVEPHEPCLDRIAIPVDNNDAVGAIAGHWVDRSDHGSG